MKKELPKVLKRPYNKPLGTLHMKNLLVLAHQNPDAEDRFWKVVMPNDVPLFVKDTDTMARLVAGDMCHCDNMNLWFRVEEFHEQKAPKVS